MTVQTHGLFPEARRFTIRMAYLRKLSLPFIAAVLTACGGGNSGSNSLLRPAPDSCSLAGQKRFVLDNMRSWYLWNDRLPASVDADRFAEPEDLLRFLTTFSPNNASGKPVDRFSSIGTVERERQFFGAGRFEGFGFSSRFLAADDLRISRVYESSPAFAAGLRRGQRILSLDARSIAQIRAAEGVTAVLDGKARLVFRMQRQDGSEFAATIAKGTVTIDPVPQWRIIDAAGGRKIGYLELTVFISPAVAKLDAAFAAFLEAGITELILDLRYNAGGSVNIAERLANYVDGAGAKGRVFAKTRYNAARAPANDREARFQSIANSLNVSDVVVIATRVTASASEMVANGLVTDARVTIVGERTLGKPVGQVGLEFCQKILRPTAFKTVNSLDFGDFFDGLPANCAVADNLNVAIGAASDPNVVAALAFLNTGACPVTSSLSGGADRAAARLKAPRPDLTGPPWREFANSY